MTELDVHLDAIKSLQRPVARYKAPNLARRTHGAVRAHLRRLPFVEQRTPTRIARAEFAKPLT